MEEIGNTIEDLVTKITPTESSKGHCSRHNLEIQNKVIRLFGLIIRVKIECPLCEEERLQNERIIQEIDRQEARIRLRRKMGVCVGARTASSEAREKEGA